MVWSVTKTMAALTVLVLADRGRARPRRPGGVVLAGVPPRRRAGPAPARAHLGVRRVDRAARRAPGCSTSSCPSGCWPSRSRGGSPGTASGYHMVCYGHLLDGLVRGRDRRPARRPVPDPGGRAARRRLPPRRAGRRAGPVRGPASRRRTSGSTTRCCPRATSWSRRSSTRCSTSAVGCNTRRVAAVSVAGVNGHGNARSIARAQSVVSHGGEVDGVRLLSPRDPRPDLRGPGRRPRPGAAACRCTWGIGYALPQPGVGAGGPGRAGLLVDRVGRLDRGQRPRPPDHGRLRDEPDGRPLHVLARAPTATCGRPSTAWRLAA